MVKRKRQYLKYGADGLADRSLTRYNVKKSNPSHDVLQNLSTIIRDSSEIDSNDTKSPEKQFSRDSNSDDNENNHGDVLDQDLEDEVTHESEKDPFFEPNDLWGFMQSERFSQKSTAKLDKTNGEIFFLLSKFIISHGLSTKAMVDLFKLINFFFKTPVLPDSKYILDKLLNPKTNVEFHAVCKVCSFYLGQYATEQLKSKCSNCEADTDVSYSSNDSFFCLIDPSSQITDLLQTYDDHYNYVVNDRVPNNYIGDVYDGRCYKEFQNSLPPDKRYSYVTATFNTDGALKFENSQRSIWPLYLMLNELPVQERLQKMVCCGLWFNDQKAFMPVYLQKFANLINTINDKGITCVVKERTLSLSLYILSAVVDAVARAPVQGITQFNGHYGCNWCLHPGDYDGAIRYPLLDTVVSVRTHIDTVQLMLESVNSSKPVFGVKYPSPFICLKYFDLIDGIIPEYMHGCLEGVASQIMTYFMKNLSDDQIEWLDHKIVSIAVPNQIQRLSRKISSANKWNAREWENFVLYYSIPLFSAIIDKGISKKKFDHWLLFVEGLYIILQDKISETELNRADTLFTSFVAKMEKTHGKHALTYNVHILLHLCKSVESWGPVWTNSTFCFESANRYMLQAIRSARGANHQVVRFVNMTHSIHVLEDFLYSKVNIDAQKYCDDVLSRKVSRYCKITDISYFKRGSKLDDQLLRQFRLSEHSLVFKKMVKNKCLYESSLLKKKRTNNCYVLLNDGSYMILDHFIVDQKEKIELTIGRRILTTNRFSNRFSKLKVIESIQSDKIAIETSNINKVCVCMPVENVIYLCSVPNLIHY